MAIGGTLEDLDLPGILQLLKTQSKTGTLHIKNPEGVEARIFFEKGNIVGSEAVASSGKVLVGDMLARAGLVRAETIEEAVGRQRSRRGRLGEILLDMKEVGREDLAEILRLQIYETVFKLLGWKEGDFQFVAGVVEFDRELISPIETEHILMDSFRMVDEWPLIKRWIARFSLVAVRTEPGRAVLGLPQPPPAQPASTVPGRAAEAPATPRPGTGTGTGTGSGTGRVAVGSRGAGGPEDRAAPWELPIDDGFEVPAPPEVTPGAHDPARGEPWRERQTEVPRESADRRPAGSTPPGPVLRDTDGTWVMSAAEARVFGLVDDARTVQAIIDLSRLGEFGACQALVGLLRRGLIRLVEPKDKRGEARGPVARAIRIRIPPWVGRASGYAALGVVVVSFLWFLASTILPLGPLGAEGEARRFPLWSLILQQKVVTVNNALRVYYLEKGYYPEAIENLVDGGFLSAVDVKSLQGAVEYEGPSKGRVRPVGEPPPIEDKGPEKSKALHSIKGFR